MDDLEKLQAQLAVQAESIEKLEANNKNLKKEKDGLSSKLSKFDSVDLEKLQSAATKLEQLENDKLEKEGEYKTLHDNLQKQYETETSTLKQQAADARAALDTETKVNVLTNSLVAVGVDPVLLDIATNSLVGDVALNDDRKAMVGGKPVADFVKEWSEGDVGKRFIPSGNSGGGAGGSGSGNTAVEDGWFKPGGSEFNRTKQGQLRKTNPELAERLLKKYAKK